MPHLPPLLYSFLVSLLVAAPAALAFEPVPRAVLVLFDSREGETTARSELAEKLHLPLVHLGLDVVHRDVSARPLPDPETMARYHAVALWDRFTECDDDLRDWLLAQNAATRRILLFEDLEPPTIPIEDSACEEEDPARNRLFHPLGFHTNTGLDDRGVREAIRVERREDALFDHEVPMASRRFLPYRFLRARDPALRVALRARIHGIPESGSDLVFTGPFGSYAASGYLWTRWPGADHDGWIADPLAFLERALGWKGMPRLDPVMVHGRRALLLRVDGDGYSSRVPDMPRLRCGELLLRDVLRDPANEFLAATVSFVVSDLLPDSPRTFPGSLDVARRIADLPGVEPASHTFAHPMDWAAGLLAHPDVPVDGRPVTYDPLRETAGSLRLLGELLPRAPRPRVLLWSGWCNPGVAELGHLEAAGMAQMNGDTPMLPGALRSLTQVTPPWVQVARSRRYTARAPSEYLLTAGWSAPFEGFRGVIDLFERTASPTPWTPVDVYLHFYVMERAPGRADLATILAWARRSELAPLFTSEYLAAMDDFGTARLESDGTRWRIRTAGALRAARFEGIPGVPDLATARGVLGYRRDRDVLWVHLDGSTTHEFALVEAGAAGAPASPYLVEASRPLDAAEAQPGDRLALRGAGPGSTELTLGGLGPGEVVEIRVEPRAGAPRRPETHVADREGRLALRLRLGEGSRIRLLPGAPGGLGWWARFLAAGGGTATAVAALLALALAGVRRSPWLRAEEEVIG